MHHDHYRGNGKACTIVIFEGMGTRALHRPFHTPVAARDILSSSSLHQISQERARELLIAAKYTKGIINTEGMTQEQIIATRKEQLLSAVRLVADELKADLDSAETERERLETKIPHLLETKRAFLSVNDADGVGNRPRPKISHARIPSCFVVRFLAARVLPRDSPAVAGS